MPGYTPNAFAANPALATQGAQVKALRGYAPNEFAGNAPNWTTSMAPHLSVPEAERPGAANLELLKSAGYGANIPANLDTQWRYSPQTYEKKISTLLEPYESLGVLEEERRKQRGSAAPLDEFGNPVVSRRRGDGDE